MSGREQDEHDANPEDLDLPETSAQHVKGGVAAGDVTGDGQELSGGDPDRPVIAAKLPGLHKVGDVTLKRG
jgi:hypothetical protein